MTEVERILSDMNIVDLEWNKYGVEFMKAGSDEVAAFGWNEMKDFANDILDRYQSACERQQEERESR